MALIKSISGIRGTIGGKAGEGLTPGDVIKYTAAYATWLTKNKKNKRVVVGRDARISGEMVNRLVTATLSGSGIDVIDIGMASTPTVEIAVSELSADGGIIITASHNPQNWNALKLLNSRGEFLSEAEGNELLEIAQKGETVFANVENLGKIMTDETMLEKHISKVLSLPLVDAALIRETGFKVAIDGINSVGGMCIPALLKALGVKEIFELNCTPDGRFAHDPEPLPENLNDIANLVINNNADVGFVVDPDVDRLAIIDENGKLLGEEYTIVSVADYVLQHTPGNTVSNLSSSRALKDITEKHGGQYFSSAVGEVNVVEMMHKKNAVIGGEGNGGVIYPACHSGRDALVGIALFLTYMARIKKNPSGIRAAFPDYVISKNKIVLEEGIDTDKLLSLMKEKYKNHPQITIDGVKIAFEEEWVHLRKSNTEPIIRVYAESKNKEKADKLAQRIMDEIKNLET